MADARLDGRVEGVHAAGGPLVVDGLAGGVQRLVEAYGEGPAGGDGHEGGELAAAGRGADEDVLQGRGGGPAVAGAVVARTRACGQCARPAASGGRPRAVVPRRSRARRPRVRSGRRATSGSRRWARRGRPGRRARRARRCGRARRGPRRAGRRCRGRPGSPVPAGSYRRRRARVGSSGRTVRVLRRGAASRAGAAARRGRRGRPGRARVARSQSLGVSTGCGLTGRRGFVDGAVRHGLPPVPTRVMISQSARSSKMRAVGIRTVVLRRPVIGVAGEVDPVAAVPQVEAVVAGAQPVVLRSGHEHHDQYFVHRDRGAGQLLQVGVVEREGEGGARRVRRDLVRALELHLDGDFVVDRVPGGAVADVPVDAVVRKGLGQRAARGRRDGVQITHLQCLHAGGGGE